MEKAVFGGGCFWCTEAGRFIKELDAVTELAPFDQFFEAENYHKDYYARNPGNPYCEVVINPKLAKFRQKFSKLLK